MSRTAEFTEDKLILHLTGLTSAAALKRVVEIPYSNIKDVSVQDFEVSLFSFRIGTSIADIREGRFLQDDKWCFISFENHKDVVVLDLHGHQFEKVVFQIENPGSIKQQILDMLKNKKK